MISIAILDDSETDLNQIELLVCTYFNRRKVTYNIKKYVKFEILMMDIQENKYFDLFFWIWQYLEVQEFKWQSRSDRNIKIPLLYI